jgi:hypothetical protein
LPARLSKRLVFWKTGGESGFLLFATAEVMSLAATRRRYSSKKQGDTPCRLAYEKNAEGYGLTRDDNEVVLGPLPDRPVGSHAPARLAVARQNPQDRPVLTESGRKADAEEIGHQTARQEALRFSLICSARLAIPGSQGPDWRVGRVAACAAPRALAPSGGSIRGWPSP